MEQIIKINFVSVQDDMILLLNKVDTVLLKIISDLLITRQKPSDQVSTKMAELMKHFWGVKCLLGSPILLSLIHI